MKNKDLLSYFQEAYVDEKYAFLKWGIKKSKWKKIRIFKAWKIVKYIAEKGIRWVFSKHT